MNIRSIGRRCTGCALCAAVCPAGAIHMAADAEGFRAPTIDAARCTDCGLCLTRCPANGAVRGARPKKAYAARSKDAGTLLESSSGGLFTELARRVLADGGCVYGAVMGADGAVSIARAESLSETLPMRGSKYVQSALAPETYAEIRHELEKGRRVLFTGCPCQVAAIRSYLKKADENLLAVDIVCHGTPSPLLFKQYLEWLKVREGGDIADYRFRDKSRGWGKTFSYAINGGVRRRQAAFDPYLNNFFGAKTFRESCYQCPFAAPERVGDATIGDYWGIAKEHPAFYDERGVSMLLVNTEKGCEALDGIRESLAIIPSEFEKISRHNMNLTRPCARPAARDGVYQGIGELPAAKYVRERLRVTNSAGEIVNALLPAKLKKRLMGWLGRIKG